MKKFGIISAVLAFVFCLAAGVWILASVGVKFGSDDGIWTAFGFYFIGKALFVGPLLILTTSQLHD